MELDWAVLELWIGIVLDWCIGTSTLLNCEAGDFARLAIVEDFEVFLFEAGDRVALRVADDNGHEHAADIKFEVEVFGLGRLLRGGEGAGTEDKGGCDTAQE